VVTLARTTRLHRSHLLHVLRRFDWFVDTYVSDPPEPDFKRIASDFESQVLSQAQQKLEAFQKTYLSDIQVANTAVVSGTHLQANFSLCEIRRNRSHHHGHGDPNAESDVRLGRGKSFQARHGPRHAG
jgi:hypothetical protein